MQMKKLVKNLTFSFRVFHCNDLNAKYEELKVKGGRLHCL